MKIFTVEEERKRMKNLAYADSSVKNCTQRVRIHGYIPGQVCYCLGGYPSKFSISPTEYDYEVVKGLAEKGVGLIQVHEEWNDAIRVLGADKYSSHDPGGMRKFIDLCHSFGIKILPYASSGFIDVRDPDYKEEFVKIKTEAAKLFSCHFRYRLGSPQSPEWCNFLMGKIKSILDNYEFDGIYNDMGYDETPVFWETKPGEKIELDQPLRYDPYLEDLLCQIYSLTKERGGITKIHIGWNIRPNTKEKVYDYLWVGESIENPESMLKTVEYDPYLIPCQDHKCVTDENYEDFYAQTLPFMQFPLGLDGRPLTAAKVNAPGVEYMPDSLTEHYRKVGEYHTAHPDGPYVYSGWSSIPDNQKNRERWAQYLKLYKPMVEENNICHLNVRESTLIKGEMPEKVYMSLFTGVEQYICMSNLGNTEEKLILEGKWQDCETKEIFEEVILTPKKVRFLQRM